MKTAGGTAFELGFSGAASFTSLVKGAGLDYWQPFSIGTS